MTLRIASIAMVCAVSVFADKAEVVKRINASTEVFNEVMQIDDKAIPRDLLQRAQCLVIVPNLKKGGFIVGAKYGKGFMMCRNTGGWSALSAIKIEGGSIGVQIGAGETDVILVVMNKTGAEKLMRSEFTLGGDAGLMAGPIGRDSTAQTDALMRAEILSYSRARGLFAGIALTGSTLRSDDKDNEALYGKPLEHKAILTGKVTKPAAAAPLYAALRRFAIKSAVTSGAKKMDSSHKSSK